MKAILLKNFLCIKNRQTLAPTVVILLYWLIAFISFNSIQEMGYPFFTYVACFITFSFQSLLCTGVIFSDKSSGWCKYVKSTPVRFSDILIAQYIFNAILALAVLIVCVLFTLITFFAWDYELSAKKIILPSLLFFGMKLFFAAVDYPLLFKFSPVTSGIIKCSTVVAAACAILVAYINKREATLSFIYKVAEYFGDNSTLLCCAILPAAIVFTVVMWLATRKMQIRE